MKIKQNILAFTLIEMMVVVAITMLLAGVGAVALNNFNNNQRVDAAKEALITDLKLARSLAKTNQVPSGAGFVLVNINNGVVSASADNGSENESYFNNENEGVVGVSSAFGFAVETGQLTDGEGILWSSSDITFTLSLDDEFGNEKCIRVEGSGLIYEEDCE